MKNRFYLLGFILLVGVMGCDNLIFTENLATRNPKQNLDYMWEQCRDKYAYFDLKKIDWDAVYREYEPRVYEGMTDDSLFTVIGNMLTELKDDHTNLISPFNISYFNVLLEGPDNFNWRTVQDYYLPRKYYITGPLTHDFLENTNREIGYVRFESFTGGLDSANLDFVINRYADTKGIILDLRENGGGAVNDVFSLLSRFIDTKTLLYYSRIKNGPGKNDFSEPQAGYLDPSENARYLKKVIMLVDRGTYSAGSFTALATKAIPNIILMGDTTGGGLGLPNGGQLPNGWYYRFSITQTLDLNLNNEFEKGVPPDIPAYFDWSNINRDEVIERAVEEIRK